MEKSRPRIILSTAISIDGKIATKTNDSRFSSKEDIERLHKLRSNVDAILVGKNTISRDDPMLTVRYAEGRNPIRIILDSAGSISKKSKILQSSDKVPTIIAVSKKITNTNLAKLQKFPIEIMLVGKNSVNLKLLLKKLLAKKIKTILVEGGGTVNWEFVKHDLFDEVIVTLSPFLIGGNDAVSYLRGTGFSKISDSPNLRLKSTKRLKNHLVLHYEKL
jgi:2,5-diamino-6-(ribosylamino)-4(3H)-pyrimidinone 5'-phosphate reductase